MFHLTLPIFFCAIVFCFFFLFTQDEEKAFKYTINTVGVIVLLVVILIILAAFN